MRRLSWQKSLGRWGVLGIVVLAALGCTYALPPAAYQPATPPVSLTQLRATPEAYTGQTMVFGGEIVRTQPLQDETLVEVLHKPLDASGRPLMTDQSEGRFLVRCPSFLDPAIYAPGREITVTGRVEGVRTEKIGEHDYRYALITCERLALWPLRVSLGELAMVYPWAWWYEDPYYSPYLWVPSHPRFHRHRGHHRGVAHHR